MDFNYIYPALSAKVRGMKAEHLSKEKMDELLSSRTLKDAIGYLKFNLINLQNLDEKMHRKEIEQELNNLFIYDILKISKYLNDDEINKMMIFLEKFKINLVKNVFRNIVTNRDSNLYLQKYDNWTNNVFKDLIGINKVTNINDFLDRICNQEFYSIYQKYLENNSMKLDDIQIEKIEEDLDKYYFVKVFNLAKTINKDCEKIIGSEIDLLNIIWIYRMKKYFQYNIEDIEDKLIPINYKISEEIIKELINTNDFEDFKKVLDLTHYKDVFTAEESMEYDKDSYLYNLNYRVLRISSFSLTSIFSCCYLIDIEKKNIINIIEGIRYHIDKELIRKKLVI